MPILMFISILVFRPEGQIWNPVRRDTRIYVRRILNASRISKLNSCTISPIMLNHLNAICDMSHVMEKPVCVNLSHG